MDWQIVGAAAGGVLATLAIVRAIGGGSWNLSGRIASMETNIVGIQNEIRRLGDVLVKISDLRGELRGLDIRLTSAEQDIRDLQHGEGMVLPISKSAYEKP